MTDAKTNTPDPFPEKEQLELKPGTLKRIDHVLKPGETREDYVRRAVEQGLQQLEKGRVRQ